MIVLDPSKMQPLVVRRSKLPLIAFILLALIWVPLSIGLFVSGVRGSGTFSLLLGGVLLAFFGVIIFIMMRARRRSVKQFSSSGILLADGTEVPWNNVLRVTDKIALNNSGQQIIWRTELEFTGGRSAWLIPNRIINFGEVHALVRSIDRPQAEEPA